jgi:hypothetical protein
VPAASAAFTVTATGTHFVAGSVVRFDGAARPTTFVSSTQVTAAIPASDVASPESHSITVFTPAPGGGTSAGMSLTVTPQAHELNYLIAYDSNLEGPDTGLVNDWIREAWEGSPGITTNFSAPAPGRAGAQAEEVVFGPSNGWNAIGFAHRVDWNTIYWLFLNQFRTVEFDVYFVPDGTGVENLTFVLEDGGHADTPSLVSLIPGWSTMTAAEQYGTWHHLVVDLTTLHANIAQYPDFERFLLFNNADASASQPHFYLTDVKLGWANDAKAPVITFGSATRSLTDDQLTLSWTTDEATTYQVDFGSSPTYGQTIAGGSTAADYVNNHTVVVNGLTPGTTYDYRITATDHQFLPAAAANQSTYAGTFSMPPPPTTPPTISGLTASGINGHRANLAWNTDLPCTDVVTYQKAGGSPMTRSLLDYAQVRSFTLDLLEPSSEYTVTVLATDPFGNHSSASITLTTTDTSTADVTVSIDTSATRTISPYIYGSNQNLGASQYTFGRMGGNNWTTFNWVINGSNAGIDWYNWNYDYLPWIFGVPASQYDTPGATILAGLDRILGAQADAPTNAGAALITVPIQGYVSADRGTNPNADVNSTGPDYLQNRFKPIQFTKGAPFTTDPGALSAEPSVYTDEYVNWVKTVAKAAHPGQGVFYSLDNEPDLWSSTHPRVELHQESYDSLATKEEEAAVAIKGADADATVFGFVSYGWYGYTYLQGAPDGSGADHNTFGDFTEYYLGRMSDAEARAGKRLVDVLDLHYYTSAQTVDGTLQVQSPDSSPDVVAARVQSTRSLWDPSYVENSWITRSLPDGDQGIRLIPRMQAKIDAKYPGTRLAITEYNFRGGQDISGAIAQADALGIFGQYGLFAASRFQMDANEPFAEAAFKMYRGFDGAAANFGDVSVAATSSDVSKVAVYVSEDSTSVGRWVIVAINRSTVAQDVALNGQNFSGTASVYQMTADTAQTQTLASQPILPMCVGQVPVSGNSWTVTLPPLSVSTIEIR